MKYSELTRRYFESTPGVGVLVASTSATAGVFRGSAGQQQRGTWVQFDIHVRGGLILEARFLVFGCPHTIAVASWLAEQAAGSALTAALPEPVQALRARFEVPEEKSGRLLIVEDAWLAVTTAAIDPSPDAPNL
jgi:NifU-like protein involved in Fe-S cluster formation